MREQRLDGHLGQPGEARVGTVVAKDVQLQLAESAHHVELQVLQHIITGNVHLQVSQEPLLLLGSDSGPGLLRRFQNRLHLVHRLLFERRPLGLEGTDVLSVAAKRIRPPPPPPISVLLACAAIC